jgi:hypothetical protein
MELIAKALGAILCALLGGYLGLRIMLYGTIGFVAGFSAWSTNRSFFHTVSSRFALFTSAPNAIVISALLLTVIPAVTVIIAGLAILKKIHIDRDHPGKTSNIALGSAYSLSWYLSLMIILS